jgi:hypothetical protein
MESCLQIKIKGLMKLEGGIEANGSPQGQDFFPNIHDCLSTYCDEYKISRPCLQFIDNPRPLFDCQSSKDDSNPTMVKLVDLLHLLRPSSLLLFNYLLSYEESLV